MFRALFRKRWVLLLVSVVLLSIAYYIDNFKEKHESNYPELTARLQNHLNRREKYIDKILQNDSLLYSFLKNGFDLENLPQLNRKDLILLIYKDTTLHFWSSNMVDTKAVIHNLPKEISVLSTANGWYLYNAKKLGTFNFVALYPFYTSYQYTNNYLQSHFNKDIKIDNTADIAIKPIEGFTPVRSIYGKKLFYLGLHPYKHNPFSTPVVVLGVIGLWLFFSFLSNQYEWFLDKQKPIWGTVFFAVVLLCVQYLVVGLKFPSFLQATRLFDPQVFASGIFPSLGALLVDVALLFIFVFTLSKQVGNYFVTSPEVKMKPAYKAVVFTCAFFILVFFTAFIIKTIRSLIIDSNIPFDISNIFTFTWFSFIGLLVTALLVFIHFFASNIVFLLTEKSRLSNAGFLIYGLGAVGLYAIYQQATGDGSWPLLVQASAYAFSLMLVLQLAAGLKLFQKAAAYVLVVSVFVALLFYRFNIDKENEIRKLYSIKLSDAKDIEAESIFLDIEGQIATDPRIFNYFTNAVFSKRDLEKHIKQLYFTGYLSKYDVEVLDYDTLGNYFRENNYYTHEFVNDLFENHSQKTLSNYFYYIVYPSVQYQYIAKYDYCTPHNTLGVMFILLKRKLIQDQSLFTELMSESSNASEQPPYNYSYALYQNNKLVNKGGKYSYTLNLSIDTTRNDEFIKDDEYSHYIKQEPNNTVIVVSKRLDSALQPLAVFSFLFLMLLVFIVLLFIYNGLVMMVRAGLAYYTGKWKPLYRFYRFARWLVPIKRLRGLLFSTRIQITMFSLVSAILLLSGYIFLRYIDFKYTERQQDKMVQKIKSVVSGFENEAQFEMQLMLPAELTAYLNQIGDFYETDINFYDVQGKLIASTKNKIFTSGLQSSQIDPMAYQKLKVGQQSFFIHEEQVGYLKYISAYVPVLDAKQSVIAYLNLPFFTNEAELNEEISAFFVNFVNLYILFFLVAGVVAYIITQRITAPLTLIQNKLSNLSLSSKNEIIEWKNSDEIGELVKQYNKMILALEESANRLAESEREGAWKEMAKQIAHEIKNPLTPMKLSVQHLQRAWMNRGENLDETFRKVTNVLIEQIDSLSNLASEFSAFAKMPAPVMEKLDLNNLIATTAELYEGTENLDIIFTPANTAAYTMGDKDQLSRVFKNIITNAIQAMPDTRKGVIEISISGSILGHWLLTFKDNGKGIDPENANKVFIPSFSTKTSGMGLGLAISKRIIETAGGKIYFQSQPGIGTVFYIELPVLIEN